MVKITEALVRKKSEHNELIISTLEELSLHQENIEKIEHIQSWCKDLQILLLQSNLISKIENLYKLKRLQYLNLSLNNIERIENLEGLESLNKLDLTLNFIGDIGSVENLKSNYNLRNLILTGNPCTDFDNYRNFVITVLPQIQFLDGVEITISDHIVGQREFKFNKQSVKQAENEYRIKREDQKTRVSRKKFNFEEECKGLDEDERDQLFWSTTSENCPETRNDISLHNQKCRRSEFKSENDHIKEIKFFDASGRPFNMNQPKLKFQLKDEPGRYDLKIEIYKFLDTSLINVTIEPNYIRVLVKGKPFQLHLNSEVNASTAIIQRSQMKGDLYISMEKLV